MPYEPTLCLTDTGSILSLWYDVMVMWKASPFQAAFFPELNAGFLRGDVHAEALCVAFRTPTKGVPW